MFPDFVVPTLPELEGQKIEPVRSAIVIPIFLALWALVLLTVLI